jgi:hypothetical protein
MIIQVCLQGNTLPLKQFVAICLLAIVCLQTIGYRIAINYATTQADVQIEARIAKGNIASETFTVRVPIQLPYQTNWAQPESISGEFELKGVIYQYISRQLVNDTMIFTCIPHTEKNRVQAKAADVFAEMNDLLQHKNSQGKKLALYKQLVVEFNEPTPTFQYNNGLTANTVAPITHWVNFYRSIAIEVQEQPPAV